MADSTTADSDVAAPPTTLSGSQGRHPVPIGDWWEVGDISHYIHSSAPRTVPDIPRTWQRTPDQDRFKRKTDIQNPYVQRQPATSHPSLLMSKKSSYKEPRKHFSLLDSEMGMEGHSAPVGSGLVKEEDKEEEKKTQEKLVEFEESTNADGGKREGGELEKKKSAMEQLMELVGSDETTVTTTSGSLFIKGLSLQDPTFNSNEQPTSSTTVAQPPVAENTPNNNDTTKPPNGTPSLPSSTSKSDPVSPIIPSHPAVTTLASQELAKETRAPLPVTAFGTELSIWLAQFSSSDPTSTQTASAAETPTGTDRELECGYVRRFQSKTKEEKKEKASGNGDGDGAGGGEESEMIPDEGNAMVKYDAFQSLWLSAVGKFGKWEMEKGRDTAGVRDMVELMEGEEHGFRKEGGKKREKMTELDELEAFLNPGGGSELL
ncbi:MAG: hypothetical protein L6R40_004751 [Gallowayella cf. fulva]|nr:MAG: hypothetical protein L6R40_004751 [Xanthomendoza cf. fulva]